MSEQLIELMLQLKKTTPAAAKQILNNQPQIAYALITLMVSMNAISFEVFQVLGCSLHANCILLTEILQKTLADFAASQGVSQPQPPPVARTAPEVQYGAPSINPAVLAAIPEDQRVKQQHYSISS